jgi:hypothetical protein
MASKKNLGRSRSNVRFAQTVVVASSGRPSSSMIREWQKAQEAQKAQESAARAARNQLFSTVFMLLIARTIELYEVEWKEVRTRISKERNRLPKPLSQEQHDRLVQKEHENALKDRLARAVYENLELLLENRTDIGPHLFNVAREVTASQVPVSLWAKYSDEEGNPLPGNPIEKGLGKGVYFLHQAMSALVSEQEQGSTES